MDGRLQLLGKSLDELPVNVSILDHEGTIIETNQSWQEFGRHNNIQTEPDTVGVNYLDVCERSQTETAGQAARGLSELLNETRDQFTLEYPCHSPVEQRWYLLLAVPFTIDGERHAIVAHVNITEYKLAERRLTQRHDRLDALNDLNTAVRELTHVVIDQSTRPEIEQSVCSVLAETEAFNCVWVGEVEARTDSVTVRANAGDCDETIAVGTDVDFETVGGYNVVRQAVWTQAIQTTNSMHENPAFDWTDDTGESYAYQSVAAVPISHEGTLYSVVCLTTDRKNAFGTDEQAILTQLTEIIGHAIGARERKQALMNDELIEVEVRIPSVFETGDHPHSEWTVDITQTVAGAKVDYTMYGLTTEDDLDAVTAAIDTAEDAELTVIGGNGETVRIAIRLSRQCVIPLLAAHGWSTKEAVFDTGDCYLKIHLPSGDDVRRMIEIINEVFPDAELLARRQIQSTPPFETELPIPAVADLTDRQRTVLQTAYAAGYFQWPRDTSGAEIAEMLGISPPTFHQHLRVGQRKLMNAIFDELPITT